MWCLSLGRGLTQDSGSLKAITPGVLVASHSFFFALLEESVPVASFVLLSQVDGKHVNREVGEDFSRSMSTRVLLFGARGMQKGTVSKEPQRLPKGFARLRNFWIKPYWCPVVLVTKNLLSHDEGRGTHHKRTLLGTPNREPQNIVGI